MRSDERAILAAPIVVAGPGTHRHHPVLDRLKFRRLVNGQTAQCHVEAVKLGHLAGNCFKRGLEVSHGLLLTELHNGCLLDGGLMV
ncbi:hypothetical protein D3C86_1434910 [compost metagenome]